MNVLIIGGASRLAPNVVKAIEPYHQLRISDIVEVETKHQSMLADVGSHDDMMQAAQGMDAIINCTVVRNDRQGAFDVNVRGPYNMMRAAVAHGIKRVINTGPHFSIAGPSYENIDYDINPDNPPHPGTNLYALSKGLGQEICKTFTQNHDVYLLCLLFYHFCYHDDPPSKGTIRVF